MAERSTMRSVVCKRDMCEDGIGTVSALAIWESAPTPTGELRVVLMAGDGAPAGCTVDDLLARIDAIANAKAEWAFADLIRSPQRAAKRAAYRTELVKLAGALGLLETGEPEGRTG